MKVFLRSNGKVEFVDGNTSTVVAGVGFAGHFAGWSWAEPTGRRTEEGGAVLSQVVSDKVQGCIEVKTILEHREDEVATFDVCVIAVPSAEQTDVCSACLHLFLNSKVFEGGSIEATLCTPLPGSGDNPQENCALLTKAPTSRYASLKNGFTVSAAKGKGGGGRIVVEFLDDSRCSDVNFVDIRKWAPTFDIRIGDNPKSPFQWGKGEERKWHCRIKLQGVSVSTPNLRFPLLSQTQKQEFRENGFLVLPNLVPLENVHNALRVINAHLVMSGCLIFNGFYTYHSFLLGRK